ncbi:flagellar basal-body MS-ring/collar protein FliF [Bacillaceae bacterium]
MSEKWQLYKEKFIDYWNSLNKRKKFLILGTFLFFVAALSILTYVVSRTEYVPLYTSELSQAEIGEIKAELDKQGYTDYRLSPDGRSILVPKEDAPNIVVDLAAQGFPKSGAISSEVFSQNFTFGATDRQLDVLEKDLLESELSALIKRISGIRNADVMITLPQESVFVRPEQEQEASASVVVEVEPGYKLSEQQIRALYYLVSRSVPKLPLENIVITNQYSEILELPDETEGQASVTEYDEQRKIKREIEKDIQRDLQAMLGTIMGADKVFVHTYVKLNFDKVNTEENLVQPVDEETNRGIPISEERISKSFQGEGTAPGGVVNPPDDVNYAAAEAGNSEYEEQQDRVNYEVNRISRKITQNPYEIEDITINVGIEPPDPANPDSLTPETQQYIERILANVVRTALGEKGMQMTQQEIEDRVTVFPQVFSGRAQPEEENAFDMPLLYGLGALAALAIGGLAYAVVRRRRRRMQEEELEVPPPAGGDEELAADGQEMDVRRQLERMAKQKPEEFVKLLRTWLTEE